MTDEQAWAARQLADYDRHEPGSIFAEGVMLNLEEGYALQSAVAELRCLRGEQIIGYKVGCTSATIRAQLGIGHCVAGRLFGSEKHPSGTVLSRKGFAQLAIEGELAVVLWREPTGDDFSGGGIPACVERVIPVIELHNHVLRGARPSAGELVANNAIHAGFVAGDGVRPECFSGEVSLSIFSGDRLLDCCEGPALIQTMCSSLEWLLGFVQARGDRLGAGHIVLTGSVPALMPVDEACRIRVDAPPFGSVEVALVD